jgi:chemotaxis protein MotB
MMQPLQNHSSRKFGRRRHQSAESHERWLLSYADLVTLLLALFVVLYAAADHERAQKISAAVSAQFTEGGGRRTGNGVLPGTGSLVTAQSALEKAFRNDPNLNNRAHLKLTERGLVVSLTEAGFFAPGDASIRPDAVPVLSELAAALQEVTLQVRVEGHTDSLPISNARFPSNWELSAGRAGSVVAQLVQLGVPAGRLSVAGFADGRPVADNSTPEGRAQNRRVDLVVLGGQ